MRRAVVTDENKHADAIEALYATAHWLLDQGRPDDAAGVLRLMLLAAPRDGRAWLALGACHEKKKQPKLALELYWTGRLVAERPARCALARARLLRRLGDDDDADEALLDARALAEAAGDAVEQDLVRSVAGGASWTA